MTELDIARIGLADLEAMRLCDLERLEQKDAGVRMRISRGTVQRLLRSGRAKVLRAILDSSALVIEKGDTDVSLHPDRG